MVQISLAFGLAVAVGVQINGPISGGYLNPAVTLAGLVAGRLSLIRSILFVIFQIIGGIGLLFLNNLIYGLASCFSDQNSDQNIIPTGILYLTEFNSNRNSATIYFCLQEFLLEFLSKKQLASPTNRITLVRNCSPLISNLYR